MTMYYQNGTCPVHSPRRAILFVCFVVTFVAASLQLAQGKKLNFFNLCRKLQLSLLLVFCDITVGAISNMATCSILATVQSKKATIPNAI